MTIPGRERPQKGAVHKLGGEVQSDTSPTVATMQRTCGALLRQGGEDGN